ncbi:MAG: hypothetical protein WBQ94_21985 [Terracidiphilus sp.]
MKRTEPPPLAVWTLEHLTPGDRDDALAGDLLEDFYSGRTGGWYRRQVVQACSIAWISSLRARASLLVFALLWSMLAPAWKALVDRIENSGWVDWIWHVKWAGPLSPLAVLVVWVALNAIYLWGGMLVFLPMQPGVAKAFRWRSRAFLTALLVFVPAYAATFVLANLYWYSFFAGSKVATTAVGQIADLRMLADVTRVPYFIALLCALWGTVPRRVRARQSFLAEQAASEPSAQPDPLATLSNLDPFTVRRFFGLMVGAGLINAMIAGFILCRLPHEHLPTFSSLLMRAIIYVAIGALAGVVGTGLYWASPASPFRKHPPIPFPLFALVCSAAWVWVPALVLFSEQISAATALVAVLGATLLGIGLRNATYSVFAAAQPSANSGPEKAELFAESLYRAPMEIHGYLIAIFLYAAVWALVDRSNLTAAALLALSGFLFAWIRTFGRTSGLDHHREYRRAAALVACAMLPAVMVTVWALMDGVAHRNHDVGIKTALAAGRTPASDSRTERKVESVNGVAGYESLILWPVPEKKQLISPLPVDESFLAKGTKQPLIIPFDGAYWYLQPPDNRPGPTAHQAHGTPLGAEIESNNFIPLVMDAHQELGRAIPVARCREIEVEIANRDNREGAIQMAVLLTDGGSTRKQTLYLGQQRIVSTEPGHFVTKTTPVHETLRFSVPEDARIRRFREITVIMLPDVKHRFVGPKIAIEQFQLFPR